MHFWPPDPQSWISDLGVKRSLLTPKSPRTTTGTATGSLRLRATTGPDTPSQAGTVTLAAWLGGLSPPGRGRLVWALLWGHTQPLCFIGPVVLVQLPRPRGRPVYYLRVRIHWHALYCLCISVQIHWHHAVMITVTVFFFFFFFFF